MKRHLQCAEQQVSRSNLTKYCACHEKWLDCFIVLTYETSFPMRGATGVTIQPHQILRLPRKMTRLLYRPRIWNVISNARSNRCHDPTSPNTAPATKNDTARFQRKSPKTGETSFPMRGRSEHDPSMIRPWKRKPQPASQPRLLFDLTTSIFYCKIQRFAPNLTFKHSPSTAPATKSDAWTSPSTAPATKSDTWTSPSTAPATKSDTWTSPSTAPATKSDTRTSLLYSTWLYSTLLDSAWLYTYESSFTMRGATGVTIQLHQILRLPRRKTHLLNHHHVWNLIYNAGSNRCHHPTSPNTAPATQNDSHAWSSSHMKPHFQCAEQQVSRSNLTKYCACHEKWHCKISKKISKNRWNVISNAGPIRAWSEHENANRNPPRNRGYFSTSPRAFSIVKYNVSRPILHSNIHQVLRLPRKVTLERHQVLRLPRKVTLERHQVLHLPRKVTLELHYSTLLDSTLLYLTLLDSTWLYLTLLDSTWLYLILLDSTLLYSTWLYSTLLDSTWLCLTRLDSTWLYLTLLDSTWFYLTLVDSTLLDSTWLYSTLLDPTWLYSTLLDSTLLDSTWHYSTWL